MMEPLDKPAYLRKNIKLADPTDGPNSSILECQYQAVCEENSLLKERLTELIASAHQNQQTQEKFYALELYFLQSLSYDNLLNRLLIDLKSKLRLTQVELYLFDPEQEVRQLIEEIYGAIDHPNLFYVDKTKTIRDIYSGSLQVTLSQSTELIDQLFLSHKNLSQSVALLPLVRGSQILGSLHMGSRDPNRFHSGLASNFLQHLGSVISVCLENTLNQERFKHLSLVDLLTRTKNRRYFFQILAKEIARAARAQTPLSCLFMDIDHFKQVNDVRGHLVGDKALRSVAKSIQPLLRQSDVLARFGGEEFTVLLPDSDMSQAAEIAERIRQHVSRVKIEDDNKTLFNVTLSIGVSSWTPQQSQLTTPDSIQNYLIHQADQGVYLAKREGRNCVRMVLP